VAAAAAALEASLEGIRDGCIQVVIAAGHHRESDSAGYRDGFVLNAENVFLNAAQQLLTPSLDVVFVTALQQHEELHATEASHDLVRVQGFLQQHRELDQHLLTREGADVLFDGAELIELHHCQASHAAGGRCSEAGLERFEELAPVQETCSRIGAHGL